MAEHDLTVIMLVAVPVLGALFTSLCPAQSRRAARLIGLLSSLTTLGIWVYLRLVLPPRGLLIGIHATWVESLGVSCFLALDAPGLLLAGLVAVVVTAAMAATRRQDEDARRSVLLLLLAEGGMLGVVTAWDLLLFVIFWEVTLVPFFFLMGPGPERRNVSAATRLLVTSVSSSVLLWVGIMVVVVQAGRPFTFDLQVLGQRLAGTGLAGWAWLFGPAFLMRLAVVPLHTWLPVAVAGVPTSAAMLLVGAVVPLGGYGLWHVLHGLSPMHYFELAPWLTWLGVITALAGGMAALVQRDLKRLLAYAFISQSGLILCGLATATAHSAVWPLLLSMGLTASGLFLFSGVICAARGSQRILDMGGLWRSHPFFSGLAFAAVASVAAIPGTLGFVGVVGVLQELSGKVLLAACLAAAGVVMAGMVVLWAYRFVLGGSHIPAVWSHQRWPLRRQVVVLFVLAVLLLASGVMPGLAAAPAPASARVATLVGQAGAPR